MIIFDLKCAPQGHVFEAWFASSAAFDEQLSGGLLACPLCASAEVAKAPMAPAVAARCEATSPTSAKAALAAVAELQKRLLQGSEGVGTRFADEARAIHLGEAEARAIHGEATLAEAESLIDDGIPIAPLPLPIVPPGEEN
ncbi:MAG TPA: DUF1178 family protein [Allosphingosinicella sp.]|jgi:hypothetical protein